MTIASSHDLGVEQAPTSALPGKGKPWLTNGRSLAILGVFVVLIFFANARWLRDDMSPPAWDAARYLVNSLDAFDLIRQPSLASLKELYFVRNTVRPSIGMVLPTMPFYLLFGVGDDTATLWTNVLFLAIIIFSVYGIGKQLFDIRVGLLGALLIGLNPEMIRLSRIYWPELGVAAVVSLAVYLLASSDFLRRKVFVLLAGVVLGLGLMERPVYPALFLAGPVAFVFIGSLLAGKKADGGTLGDRFLSRFLPGAVLFAVPAALIGAPFYLQYGKQMISMVSAFETAGTFAPVKDATSLQSLLWYATNLYASVSWPLHILFVASLIVYITALVMRRVRPASAIVLAWVVVPYVALSLTASKVFSYISSLYPALALFLGFAVLFVFQRSRVAQLAASALVLALAVLTYSQVSWEQPLSSELGARLAMYATVPSSEDWRIEDIIAKLGQDLGQNSRAKIGVVSAISQLSEPPLSYAARAQGLDVEFIRVSNPLPTLLDADYVIAKSDQVAPDPSRTIEGQNALWVFRVLRNQSSAFYKNHQLIGEIELPDGSQAQIYKRTSPATLDEKQAIEDELTAAASDPAMAQQLRQQLQAVNMESQIRNGDQLLAEGNLEEARTLFQQIVANNPNSVAAHNGLARASFGLGDCPIAIEHQSISAQLLPRNGSYTVLGDIYSECGKLDEAIDAYLQAMQLDDKDVRTHFVLARAYAARGRIEEAVAEYKRTIELDTEGGFTERAQHNLQLLGQ